MSKLSHKLGSPPIWEELKKKQDLNLDHLTPSQLLNHRAAQILQNKNKKQRKSHTTEQCLTHLCVVGGRDDCV